MINFWKMQGAGNDFVTIDGRFDNINNDNYSDLALKLCHRKFGIGADGLLIVKNSDIADIEMVYYNADGSRAEMCGNGIRCFSKFVYENNIVKKDTFTVSTLDGIKVIDLNIDKSNDLVKNIKVNMGKPNFNAESIPVLSSSTTFIEKEITVLDKSFTVSSVLMGVPHSVIFMDKLNKDFLLKYGSYLENHEVFPKNCNINFVEVVDDNTIKVQTWERGCGYTLACGTGMTASAIISNLLGKTDSKVKTISEGGEVFIEIDKTNIYMIGSAVKVFEGTI